MKRGRRQKDPGTCFHPVSINSHTRKACAVITVNSRIKNPVIPKSKGLA